MSPRVAGSGPVRITLLTDFGTRDGYVGAMRGVIATIAPQAVVEDASHDLAAGDVMGAAWALGNYWNRYPSGTIHVAVIDPGVGSERRALAAEADDRFLLAPDNGILTRVLVDAASARVVEITDPAYLNPVVSATFHGRDVFAPAAAHLATGVGLDRLGPVVSDPVRLDLLLPQRTGDIVRGQVVHIDRFGNLITNIPAGWIDERRRVRVAATELGEVRRNYSAVPSGHALALIGSGGYLEIGVRDGNAAKVLWKGLGAEVVVEPEP